MYDRNVTYSIIQDYDPFKTIAYRISFTERLSLGERDVYRLHNVYKWVNVTYIVYRTFING